MKKAAAIVATALGIFICWQLIFFLTVHQYESVLNPKQTYVFFRIYEDFSGGFGRSIFSHQGGIKTHRDVKYVEAVLRAEVLRGSGGWGDKVKITLVTWHELEDLK